MMEAMPTQPEQQLFLAAVRRQLPMMTARECSRTQLLNDASY